MNLRANVLNPSSLYKLADDLRKYADSMPMKIQRFLEALADRGIEVARQNEGYYAGYIVYSKEFSTEGKEYVLRMIAKDSQKITNYWYSSDSDNAEIRSDTFSPLLMAEFGSGTEQRDAYGVGRLPNSYGHGGDSKGWYWWSDEPRDGEWKHSGKNGRSLYYSSGMKPTMPVHHAVITMIEEVETIARSVFG